MKKNSIIIHNHHGIRDLLPHIGLYLKSKDFNVIFIVKTKQDTKFYKKRNLIFYDEIVHTSNKLEHQYVKGNKKKIDFYEKKLAMPIYKIFFTHRTFGRGFFSSGGHNHPITKAQKILKHEDLMQLALDKLDFWHNLFVSKNVKYAMNLPLEAHILAKNYNIVSKRTIIGKFNNTRDWSSDLYYQPDNIEKLFKKSKLKKSAKVELKTPLDAHLNSKKRLVKEFKLFNTLHRSFYFLLQHLYGRAKGNTKSKSIFIIPNFIGYWRKRSEFLKLKNLVNVNIDKSKNINFIYFPLLTEPEIALHGISSDFFFQLSAINILSRDLPSNFRIIVKEPVLAIGRRPKQFYEQILSLKNVLFADPLELGLEYVKNAKVVACLTGTSMWEAAVLGIPVISFSENNVINCLDHVFHLSNFKNSDKLISKILKKKYPNEKSINDGSIFYKIYNENSLDMKNIKEFHSWKETSVNKKNISAVYKLVERFLEK